MIKENLICKDVNALQVKTIKSKMINQIEKWKYQDPIDPDWSEIIGYYNDTSSIKTWKMIIFRYSKGVNKRLYIIDNVSYFCCIEMYTKDHYTETDIIIETSKIPQLFLD